MSQKITIVIDGKDGRIDPDAVGNVLRAVFGLAKSIDEKSWPVGAARIKWRTSEVRLVNPLTFTATAEEVGNHVGPPPEVSTPLVNWIEKVGRGVRPPGELSDKDVRFAKIIGSEVRRFRSLMVIGTHGEEMSTVGIARSFLKKVKELNHEGVRTETSYGSLDGTLIALVNDPLKSDGSARLRERGSTNEVICRADPKTSERLAHHMNRETRVILYGNVTREDGIAHSIQVEDFSTVEPASSLPTLDQIHALKFRVPRGKTIESYLRELRGDE